MKLCLKCGQEKELSEFGKDNQKKSGLCQYCKVCIRIKSSKQKKENPKYYDEYSKSYREKNRENLRIKSSERFKNNRIEYLKRGRESYYRHQTEIAKRRKEIRKSPEFKEKTRIRIREWRLKNPEKSRRSVKNWQKKNKIRHAAHQRVHRAVEEGKLMRSEYCLQCGKKCKTEGHHEDYSKPLDVIWLCRLCHASKIEKL
jgi:hypothetical protein